MSPPKGGQAGNVDKLNLKGLLYPLVLQMKNTCALCQSNQEVYNRDRRNHGPAPPKSTRLCARCVTLAGIRPSAPRTPPRIVVFDTHTKAIALTRYRNTSATKSLRTSTTETRNKIPKRRSRHSKFVSDIRFSRKVVCALNFSPRAIQEEIYQ